MARSGRQPVGSLCPAAAELVRAARRQFATGRIEVQPTAAALVRRLDTDDLARLLALLAMAAGSMADRWCAADPDADPDRLLGEIAQAGGEPPSR